MIVNPMGSVGAASLAGATAAPLENVSATSGGAAATAALYGSLGGSQSSNALQTVLSGGNFMQLLISELQNQNPSNPLSSSSFISQMTSMSMMSSMQQLTQAMSQLGQIGEANAAVGLLGQTVTAASGSGTVTGTVTAVDSAAGSVTPTLVLSQNNGATSHILLSAVQSVTRPGGG